MGEFVLLIVIVAVLVTVMVAFLLAIVAVVGLVALLRGVDFTKWIEAARARQRAALARRVEPWIEVASERGWSEVDGPEHQQGATAAGARLVVRRRSQYYPDGKGGGRTERWVELRVHEVAPPGSITAQQLLHLTRDRSVGAPAFDRSAFVRVADEHLPRFGHRFQAAWLTAREAGLGPSVREGEIVVRLNRGTVDADQLRALADHAEALASAIHDGPIQDVLRTEIREAEAEGYRVRCLRQLAEVAPEVAAAEARTLSECGQRELEVEALGVLGDLDALLRQVADADLSPQAKQRMVHRVVDLGDADQVALGLRAAAGVLLPGQLRQLFERVAETPRGGSSAGLLGAAEGLDDRPPSTWDKVGVAWCRALAAQTDGAPGAEEALARRLEHPEIEVVIAAATALRDVGTAAAVPALSARADRVGLLGSSRVTAACQQAISAIQGRATGVVGDVSLAAPAPERGALSEAAQRRGRLPEGS